MQHSQITQPGWRFNLNLTKQTTYLFSAQNPRQFFLYTWSLQLLNGIEGNITHATHIVKERFECCDFASYGGWTIGLTFTHLQEIASDMLACHLRPVLNIVLT